MFIYIGPNSSLLLFRKVVCSESGGNLSVFRLFPGLFVGFISKGGASTTSDYNYPLPQTAWHCCEALYPSGSEKKRIFRPSVRFCNSASGERASLKILSVIWAIDFAWSENWMAVNRVSGWDRPVRGPFFGWKKMVFLRKNVKSGLWFLPLVNGAKMALFWTDVGGVTEKTLSNLCSKPCFAPLPCTVYLVTSW